jgi:hypothetical protein
MFGYEYVKIVLIRQGVVNFPVMVVDSMQDLVEVEYAVDD